MKIGRVSLTVLAALCFASLVDAQLVKIKTPAEIACSFVPDGTYIADPNNCQKFFKCENKKPIPGTCSSTTRYSVVDNACVITKNAICVKDFQNIVCRGRNDGEWVPDPTTCSRFYTCTKQKANATPTACTGRNTVFNRETQKCVPKADYECPPEGHCVLISDKVFTSHSHSLKCSSYYVCMSNIAIPGECRLNYGYNKEDGVCDYKYQCNKIVCDKDRQTPVPNMCGQFHECKKNEINEPSTCPIRQHFNEALQNCTNAWDLEEPCSYDRCHNMPDGFYTAVKGTQCTQYNFCLKGKSGLEKYKCPDDYPHLNEEFQQCVKRKPNHSMCL